MNDEREPRAPDLSGILSQISSNPNAMAMLGSLLGNVSPPVKHPEASTDSCTCKEILPPKAYACFWHSSPSSLPNAVRLWICS